MYSNKLAVAIKHAGSVLREHGDKVLIPFGSEYSLQFHNLNTVKCLVSIEIDGKNISPGRAFVVEPGISVDVERFVAGDNLESGQRFKFIERTAAISAHRGNKVQDGLVKIQFEFARPTPPPPLYVPFDEREFNRARGIGAGSFDSLGKYAGSMGAADQSAEAAGDTWMDSEQQRSYKGLIAKSAVAKSAVGITVGGSVSNQRFEAGAPVQTDGITHTMVFQLCGEIAEKKIEQPVTVKTRITCPTCGIKNPSAAKFCSECGTGLILF